MSVRKLITFGMAFGVMLLVVGAAAAAPSSAPNLSGRHAVSSGSESDDAQPEADDGQGEHGGSIERFHEDCALPEGAEQLEGNWTHGDYVSVWAHSDHSEPVSTAAQSDCGKPLVAVGDSEAQPHGKSGEAHSKSGEAHSKSGDHSSQAGS